MSWIYSIFVAGLLFSGEDIRTLPAAEPVSGPVVAEQKDETERFEQSYPLSADGRVRVSNINGPITVEAWDRNEVKLEAVKRAETRELLNDVQLVIDANANSFSVEAEYKRTAYTGGWKEGRKGNAVEVEFKLWVPRNAVLDEIETVNGSAVVSNFTNVTKVSTVNGDVIATNLRGVAELSTVNGEVRSDFDRIDGASKVSLSTVNGGLTLGIPSDVNATLKADTLNGNITNDFGLPVRKGEYVGRDLYGRIGTGEAQIKLNSVNGPITINRKNDGRNPNPVIDMLPQMEQGDGTATNEINRNIERSIRVSQREAAAAMRHAQREMDRIKPELDRIKLEKLEKLNIKIDEKAIERSVADAMRARGDLFARMRNANWIMGVPRVERKTKTLKVSGTPRVAIDAQGCNVSIRGWDQPEIKYTLTEISNGPDGSDADVTETVSGSDVRINVTGTHADAGLKVFPAQHRYRLEVFVPVRSDLTVKTDGEVRVNGVKGSVDIAAVDESIDVRGGEGALKIAAEDAQVRVVGFRGDMQLTAVDSQIYLEGDFTSLGTTTVDGSVTLSLPDTPNATIRSNRPITLEHQGGHEKNGTVLFGTGAATYKLDTEGGKVVVRRSSLIASM